MGSGLVPVPQGNRCAADVKFQGVKHYIYWCWSLVSTSIAIQRESSEVGYSHDES